MLDPLDDLMSEQGKKIQVYVGRSIISDPEEQDKKVILTGSIPIQAICNPLTSEQVKWKMGGISTSQGMEIITFIRYKPLLKLSQKFVIDGVEYVGYKTNDGRCQIKDLSSIYCRIQLYRES